MRAGALEAVVEPATPAEAAGALREAAARGAPVRVCGRGTRIAPAEHLAGRLPEGCTLLRLARLDAITRLRPEDLTVSVQAGCPLARLVEEAAAHGLWLPFDPPAAADRTVGGAFAEGEAGALAHGFPPPRDLLLGLTAALAEGTTWKSGSRVVKSVAGYDLPKLFTGSRGRLFVGLELHLRLLPAPRRRVLLASPPLDRVEAVERLRALRRPPHHHLAALTVLSEGGGPAVVVAEAAGGPEEVAWLEERCEGLTRRGEEEERALRTLRDRLSFLPAAVGAPAPATSGAVLPSRLGALAEKIPAAASLALHGDGRLCVHGADLLEELAALGGRGRNAAGRTTPRQEAVQRLEREMKEALDPAGILVGAGLP